MQEQGAVLELTKLLHGWDMSALWKSKHLNGAWRESGYSISTECC